MAVNVLKVVQSAEKIVWKLSIYIKSTKAFGTSKFDNSCVKHFSLETLCKSKSFSKQIIRMVSLLLNAIVPRVVLSIISFIFLSKG